jgi:hypothetical protein
MAEKGRRVMIDCRESPQSSKNCSLMISGTEEEVLETAMQHVAAKHGMQSTPQVRDQIRGMLKEEALSR